MLKPRCQSTKQCHHNLSSLHPEYESGVAICRFWRSWWSAKHWGVLLVMHWSLQHVLPYVSDERQWFTCKTAMSLVLINHATSPLYDFHNSRHSGDQASLSVATLSALLCHRFVIMSAHSPRDVLLITSPAHVTCHFSPDCLCLLQTLQQRFLLKLQLWLLSWQWLILNWKQLLSRKIEYFVP